MKMGPLNFIQRHNAVFVKLLERLDEAKDYVAFNFYFCLMMKLILNQKRKHFLLETNTKWFMLVNESLANEVFLIVSLSVRLLTMNMQEVFEIDFKFIIDTRNLSWNMILCKNFTIHPAAVELSWTRSKFCQTNFAHS